ncbi:MAG: hypothetical protein ACKOC2_06340 [Gemmatimonadota bacterium]
MQLGLVDEFGRIAPHEVQLLESLTVQEVRDLLRPEPGVPTQPAGVLEAMVEEHREPLRHRMVTEPAVFEGQCAVHVPEVEGMPELVQQRHPVVLPPMGPQDQMHEIGDLHRGAERTRTLPGTVGRIEAHPTIGIGTDPHLHHMPPHLTLHPIGREEDVIGGCPHQGQQIGPRHIARTHPQTTLDVEGEEVIPDRLRIPQEGLTLRTEGGEGDPTHHLPRRVVGRGDPQGGHHRMLLL